MNLFPWTLWRYLARHFISWFCSIASVLAGIIAIFEVVELFRRASGKPHITLVLIIKMAILKLPAALEQLLPIIIFFSCFLCLRALNQRLELVAIRASGVSMIQIVLPFLAVIVVFSLAYWMIINPLSSSMSARFESIEKKLFNPHKNSLSIVGSGLWFVKNNQDGSLIIHSKNAIKEKNKLDDVTLYVFDAQAKFEKRLDATVANIKQNKIELISPWVSQAHGWTQKHENYTFPASFSLSSLEENFTSPKTIPFSSLPKFINSMEEMGFSATAHRAHWYKLIGAPVMFLAMILWAAFFSLRWARHQKVIKTVGFACITIFALYIINELTRALGLSGALSPGIAVALSVGLIFFSGCGLLLHLQEKH